MTLYCSLASASGSPIGRVLPVVVIGTVVFFHTPSFVWFPRGVSGTCSSAIDFVSSLSNSAALQKHGGHVWKYDSYTLLQNQYLGMPLTNPESKKRPCEIVACPDIATEDLDLWAPKAKAPWILQRLSQVLPAEGSQDYGDSESSEQWKAVSIAEGSDPGTCWPSWDLNFELLHSIFSKARKTTNFGN